MCFHQITSISCPMGGALPSHGDIDNLPESHWPCFARGNIHPARILLCRYYPLHTSCKKVCFHCAAIICAISLFTGVGQSCACAVLALTACHKIGSCGNCLGLVRSGYKNLSSPPFPAVGFFFWCSILVLHIFRGGVSFQAFQPCIQIGLVIENTA